jgi:hypothetical protein
MVGLAESEAVGAGLATLLDEPPHPLSPNSDTSAPASRLLANKLADRVISQFLRLMGLSSAWSLRCL